MGHIRVAGYAVVTRSNKVVRLCLTKPGAERSRKRLLAKEHQDLAIVEVVFSTALKEGWGEQT